MCLDVFHFYTGPSKLEDLQLLNADNLVHVHLCDISGVPREIATDKDRILPGDGDWRLVELLRTIKARGYNGQVSLELNNPFFWQSKPGQVASLGLQSMTRLLDELK